MDTDNVAQAKADEIRARRQEEAATALDLGDVVTVGSGMLQYRIDGFGTWPATPAGPGERFADLAPLEGYTRRTAVLARLQLVEKAGA